MKITVEHIADLRIKAGNADTQVLLDGNPADEKALRPTDCVLMAIAGCSSMDVVSILAKMKQSFSHFKVLSDGQRSEEHPKVFTQITLIYEARPLGKNKEEFLVAFKKAISLSIERYCSVSAMLKKAGVDISYRVQLV